jgi:hypothetical protein
MALRPGLLERPEAGGWYEIGLLATHFVHEVHSIDWGSIQYAMASWLYIQRADPGVAIQLDVHLAPFPREHARVGRRFPTVWLKWDTIIHVQLDGPQERGLVVRQAAHPGSGST